LVLQPGRQSIRDHVPVEVVHDVERNAEDALVVAEGDDRRQANAVRREGELEPRLSDHVMRRGWQRRPWRPAKNEGAVVALEQEREVRPSALADPPRTQRTGAEAVLVEERTHDLEDEQRRSLELRRLRDG